MHQIPDRTGPDPRRAVSVANISDEDADEFLAALEMYFEEGRQRHFQRARRAKALIAARTTATADSAAPTPCRREQRSQDLRTERHSADLVGWLPSRPTSPRRHTFV